MKFYYAAFVPQLGGRFSVIFPDVPGCATWGETIEEAFEQALEALEGHLEALSDDGDPIPEPSAREAAWAGLKKFYEEDGESVPDGVILQLVPVPDVTEKPTRVNVSFRKVTLSMIDRKAEAAGLTRSGFLSKAAEAYEVRES